MCAEKSFMKNLEIVKMNAGHIARLAELEELCFSEPWSQAGLCAELDNPNAVFFVAVCEGETAGYAGMYHLADVCYMANLAVFPQFRHRGIAGALLSAFYDYAKQHRATELSLEVRPSNGAAVELYGKMGFKIVGHRRNFYKKPTEDAYIMTRFVVNCQKILF